MSSILRLFLLNLYALLDNIGGRIQGRNKAYFLWDAIRLFIHFTCSFSLFLLYFLLCSPCILCEDYPYIGKRFVHQPQWMIDRICQLNDIYLLMCALIRLCSIPIAKIKGIYSPILSKCLKLPIF